jgi:SAM-dependent methyltransferase
MSSDAEKAQVAAALDATPELIPYLPALLADLWDLGSSPALIVDWLREAGLPAPGARVLDLGCGKGAVALSLARELGCSAHGVDLFEPFLEEARTRAGEWDLAGSCRFERGDLREVARTARGFDAVVYASVGVLGAVDDCVAVLRQCVRSGGWMVVEDGCLAEGIGAPEPGYERYAGLAESRRRLESQGDRIVREHVLGPAEMRALDESYIRRIRARAEALAAAHPQDADLIRGYVARQERAALGWERNARSVTWLLQRA